MIYLYTDQYNEILFIDNKPSTDKNDQLIIQITINELDDLILLTGTVERYESLYYMESVFDLKDLVAMLQTELGCPECKKGNRSEPYYEEVCYCANPDCNKIYPANE